MKASMKKQATNFQMAQSFHMVCVVAMAKNRVIGDGNDLLWQLPGDLKRVKQLLSLIHISEPTDRTRSRMPSSA